MTTNAARGTRPPRPDIAAHHAALSRLRAAHNAEYLRLLREEEDARGVTAERDRKLRR
jgi:hypothetical protein